MAQSTPPPGHVAVRLTIRPNETVHVPPDEVPVLRQQGLLLEDTPADAADGDENKAPAAGATVRASGGSAKPGKDA